MKLDNFSNKFSLYTILLGLWLFPGVLLGIKYSVYFIHWLFVFLLGAAFWQVTLRLSRAEFEELAVELHDFLELMTHEEGWIE